MANVIAETASDYKAAKLNTLIQGIAALGMGPGKAPYPDARELGGMMAQYMSTPVYSLGEFTVGAAAGGDEHVVKLDFEPRLVLIFIDSATDAFLVKMRQMGTGATDTKTCLRFLVGGASAVGDFVSCRNEDDTTDLNAFTIWNAALANNDVVSWIALG